MSIGHHARRSDGEQDAASVVSVDLVVRLGRLFQRQRFGNVDLQVAVPSGRGEIDGRLVLGSGREVVKYLARYVSRSALGPAAILSDDERGVTYRYTESGTGLTKLKTLPPHAFIRRVLRHALPRGFRRLRYCGWLHPSAKKRFLRVQTLLRVKLCLGERPGDSPAPPPCPHCGGALALLAIHRPRGPPRP